MAMKQVDIGITIMFYCGHCGADNYLEQIPSVGDVVKCDRPHCKKEHRVDNIDPEPEIKSCARCGLN